MSVTLDDPEHEQEIESDNKQIIRLLKTQVFLLEIIAGIGNGDAADLIEDDQ